MQKESYSGFNEEHSVFSVEKIHSKLQWIASRNTLNFVTNNKSVTKLQISYRDEYIQDIKMVIKFRGMQTNQTI